MATVQEPGKQSSARYEKFVRDHLNQATRRVRMLDVAAAALGLVIGVLAFGLTMILLDRWIQFPQLVRQVTFFAFLTVLAAYTWFVLLRPFRLRVNPYYAAKQLEQSIPDAKNSLVNWLDLQDENLSPTVREAIGQRAADDLEDSDLDQAIKGKHLVWLGTVVVGLGIGLFLAFAAMRHEQFFSLLNRTFNPFTTSGITQQTRITVIEPAGGNVTVPVNHSVAITVKVDGRIPEPNKPDSMKLLFRYSPDDGPWEELALDRSEAHHTEWKVHLPPHRVQNGFWYRVTGGDGTTEVHRVQVRSSPLFTRYHVTYKHRDYLRLPPRESNDPNLEGIRGTEVTLIANANRLVKEGTLVMTIGSKPPVTHKLTAEPVADDPEALKYHFVLDQDARYQLYFTSMEGESNTNPLPFNIRVTPDRAPEVEITQPEQLNKPEFKEGIPLRADALLKLHGKVRDDFGVAKVTLRMQFEKGMVLRPQEFRGRAAFKLDNGTYMKSIEYHDFVDLDKLRTAAGNPVSLKFNDRIEFWLEAEDNCDYPTGANVGSSKKYTVIILKKKEDAADPKNPNQKPDPMNPDRNPETKKDERNAAEQDKQQQDRKHDAQRDKENEQIKKDEADRKNDPNNQPDKGKPEDGKQPNNPGDLGKKSDAEQKIQDLVNEKKQNPDKPNPSDDRSEVKPDNAQNNKPDPNNPPQQPNPADNKNGNGMTEQNPPADPKGSDKKDGNAQGENKQNNPSSDDQNKKSDAKKGDSSPNQNGASENKKQPDGGMGDRVGEPKDKGQPPMNADPMKKPEPGEHKGPGKPDADNPMNPMDPKNPMGANDNKQPADKAGEPKGDNANKPGDAKSPPKPAGNEPDPKNPKPENQPGTAKDKRPSAPNASDKSAGKPNEGGKPDGENKQGAKPGEADPKAGEAKQQPKADPNKQDGQGQPAADAKPDKDGQKNANNQANPKNPAGGDKNKDIREAGNQMQNGDPKDQKDAQQKLENIAKNDADPNRRKAAEEAMQKAKDGKPSEAKAAPKPNEPGAAKNDAAADNKMPPKADQQAGGEKGMGNSDAKQPPADAKKSEQANANQDRGGAKSQPSALKDGAQAKDGGKGADAQKSDAKGGDPKGQDGAASAKGGADPKAEQAAKEKELNDAVTEGLKRIKDQVSKMTPEERGKFEEKIKEMAKQGNENDPRQGELTDEQKKLVEDIKKELAKNDAKRQEAEAKNEPGMPGEGKDLRPNQFAGNNPGDGSDTRQRNPGGGNSTPEDRSKVTDPNEAHKNKGGNLTLDDLKNRVTKEDLNKRGITEEQWKKYLEDMERLARQQQRAKDDAQNDVKAADKKGNSIFNNGVKEIKTDTSGKVGDIQVGGAPVVPAEYKDAASKYSKILSRPRDKKK